MLQVSFIRENIDLVKKKLAVKYFANIGLIDEVIELDTKRRKLQFDKEEINAKINSSSKEIGALMREGKKEIAEQKKGEVSLLKEKLNDVSELNSIEESIQTILLQIPNLPANEVPIGRTPAENDVVREGGIKPTLYEGSVPHWDLTNKYKLVDFELGNKITGSGFPVYTGKGAKLQRALIQYFLDFNTAAGYTEIMPPLMVNEASAYGTGQMTDKEGQMYFATEDKFYLIPTSEVPVTNIYRDEIIKEADLPVKMTAYTPCFRREAGSYGKDVRGLNRLHQFDKVEIVQLVHPDKSYETLENMRDYVAGILKELELPYRVLKLCGGDMSFASALTYDLEVWSAAQQRWLEVSSVSNFETFQTNRLKCRYRDEKGKTQLAHSLNGSALALPRIVAALLENNQTEKGIVLPKVLHSYCGFTTIS